MPWWQFPWWLYRRSYGSDRALHARVRGYSMTGRYFEVKTDSESVASSTNRAWIRAATEGSAYLPSAQSVPRGGGLQRQFSILRAFIELSVCLPPLDYAKATEEIYEDTNQLGYPNVSDCLLGSVLCLCICGSKHKASDRNSY